MNLKVGKKFFIDCGKGNPATGTNEIRAIVDNEYAVLKFHSKKRNCPAYEIKHICFFEVFEKQIKWLK